MTQLSVKEIPVFLASDNNYAHFIATTVISACSLTSSFLHFYVLDSGITLDNKQKILSLKESLKNCAIDFIDIDANKEFSEYVETDYISRAMYLRFLIPKHFPHLQKILYIDVDIIFYGDIAQLYNQSLDSYIIGAVPENYGEVASKSNEIPKNVLRRQVLQLSETHRYFNSGVLLINCVLWNQHNVGQKLNQISPIILRHLENPDQDMLNIIFDNNYKILDEKFNVLNQVALNHVKNGQVIDCVIRHFNDKKKPNMYRPFVIQQKGRYVGITDYWNWLRKTPFFEEQAKKFSGFFLLEKLFR